MGRIQEIYRMVADTPPIIFQVLGEQKERLGKAKEKFGDYIEPEKF
jgi:phosphoenolpyruvate carboxykinase (GTP)